MFLQRKYCRQPLPEVGKDNGFVNYRCVSTAVERVKAGLLRDRKIKEFVDTIEK